MILSGRLTDLVEVEIPGMGKGFKGVYYPPESEQNSGIGTYRSDIGQIANGLAQAVYNETGVKHSLVPDPLSKTPMFLVKVEDILPYTKYVVFGCKAYIKRGEHPDAVALLQDESCDYKPAILKKFVKSLINKNK